MKRITMVRQYTQCYKDIIIFIKITNLSIILNWLKKRECVVFV